MLQLKAQKRETFGKKLWKDRTAGRMPVVVYGGGEKPLHFFVETKDFLKIWEEAGESTVIKLDSEIGKKDVLVQDVAVHPVTGSPLHADLYAVKADQLITISVPLVFEGVSPAVKNFNGVLVKVLHEVEVEAIPANLPHELKVDVSKIETLEDQVAVKDIKLPIGVRIVTSLEEIVALVSVAKEEVEEETGPVDLSKIEVEKKGKKEEETTEGTATPTSNTSEK